MPYTNKKKKETAFSFFFNKAFTKISNYTYFVCLTRKRDKVSAHIYTEAAISHRLNFKVPAKVLLLFFFIFLLIYCIKCQHIKH